MLNEVLYYYEFNSIRQYNVCKTMKHNIPNQKTIGK